VAEPKDAAPEKPRIFEDQKLAACDTLTGNSGRIYGARFLGPNGPKRPDGPIPRRNIDFSQHSISRTE
jgi:hypothetical protein